MAGPGAATSRASASTKNVVMYSAWPKTHLWIAACLGLFGAVLGACAVLGLGEVLAAAQRQLLEALFLPS